MKNYKVIPEFQIKLGMQKLELIFSKNSNTYTEKEKEAMNLFYAYDKRTASKEALKRKLI